MIRYLNHKAIKDINVDWSDCIKVISETCFAIYKDDFFQPLKPYLQFHNTPNRIIAMPAYVGGNSPCSGIKWIASFPENIKLSKPRANSVTILNDLTSGEPYCIINTSLISVIRTVSVSGLVIQQYLSNANKNKIKLGIIGLGPIGQYHIKMFESLFSDRLKKLNVFDLNDLKVSDLNSEVNYCKCWQDVFEDADIVITCTSSHIRYIDMEPKPGSLHLNISLRDYKIEMYDYFKHMIVVDNWEEVCRKDTDIEAFSIARGLKKENTISLIEMICEGKSSMLSTTNPIFFNPMGLAAFDITIAKRYYTLAQELNRGVMLE